MVVDSRHWGLYEAREDMIQEVRKRLYENLLNDRFRGGSTLKTYVIQMAKYVAIEHLRRKIRNRADDIEEMEVADHAPGPELLLASSERERLFREAMARLPDRCRELFELIFGEELPYEDTAERLGIAPGTVKSRAWRCRETLLKTLKKAAT